MYRGTIRKIHQWILRVCKDLRKKTKTIAGYIERYTRHPAIVDARIIRYEGESMTFRYERNKERKIVPMSVEKFIQAVIKHIRRNISKWPFITRYTPEN